MIQMIPIAKRHCPSMQNLAVNSRTYSSQRLTKSGVGRVMEKADPSISDGAIGTATFSNDMVLVFLNKVKSSVNQGFHQSKTCFDAKFVVFCPCDCESSCKLDPSMIKKLDKKSCTNFLSLIVSIFAFSCEGLAHHLTIELKIRLNHECSVAQLDFKRNMQTFLAHFFALRNVF